MDIKKRNNEIYTPLKGKRLVWKDKEGKALDTCIESN